MLGQGLVERARGRGEWSWWWKEVKESWGVGGSQLRGGSVKVGAVNTCSPRVRPLAAHFHVIGRRLSLLVHAFSPPLAAHAPRFSIAGPYRRALCRRGLGSASRAEAVHLGPGRRRWRVRYNRCARSSIGCAGKEPWRHQGSEPSWCTRSGLREERRGVRRRMQRTRGPTFML